MVILELDEDGLSSVARARNEASESAAPQDLLPHVPTLEGDSVLSQNWRFSMRERLLRAQRAAQHRGVHKHLAHYV
jgi:hypothetical protein